MLCFRRGSVGRGHVVVTTYNEEATIGRLLESTRFLRLGILDGREGLLLPLYLSAYLSWNYAKAWELARINAG